MTQDRRQSIRASEYQSTRQKAEDRQQKKIVKSKDNKELKVKVI